jgi:hypothetical protein
MDVGESLRVTRSSVVVDYRNVVCIAVLPAEANALTGHGLTRPPRLRVAKSRSSAGEHARGPIEMNI